MATKPSNSNQHSDDAADGQSSSTPSATAAVSTTQKVRLVAVETGKNVAASAANAAARSVAVSQLLQSTALNGSRFVTSASLVGAAQVEGCAVLALRVPILTNLAGACEVEGLMGMLEGFAASEAAQEIASLPAAQKILLVGIEGPLIAVVVAAVFQQAIASVKWVRGDITTEELHEASVGVAVQAAGTLGGSVAGAAVGTLLFPGAGTALGALLGSTTVGIGAVWWYGSSCEAQRVQAAVCWNQSRLLEVKDLGDDWLGVADAPTRDVFRIQYDNCDQPLPNSSNTTTTNAQQQQEARVSSAASSSSRVDSEEGPNLPSCTNFSKATLQDEHTATNSSSSPLQNPKNPTQLSNGTNSTFTEVDDDDCITLYFAVPQ